MAPSDATFRLASRYSIRHGRRIVRAIFRCVIRAFGRWNRLRLLIKWRCHDALLSLSSSITSTRRGNPGNRYGQSRLPRQAGIVRSSLRPFLLLALLCDTSKPVYGVVIMYAN